MKPSHDAKNVEVGRAASALAETPLLSYEAPIDRLKYEKPSSTLGILCSVLTGFICAAVFGFFIGGIVFVIIRAYGQRGPLHEGVGHAMGMFGVVCAMLAMVALYSVYRIHRRSMDKSDRFFVTGLLVGTAAALMLMTIAFWWH